MLGVSDERVRARVRESVGPAARAVAGGQIGFTGQAAKALERALQEARSMNHYGAGSEHILLGMLSEDDGL